MEEAPENSKESSHSAHANGMNVQNLGLSKRLLLVMNWLQALNAVFFFFTKSFKH
jgi:hypothetical protein